MQVSLTITPDEGRAARNGLGLSAVLSGFISGLTLSNNVVDGDHDIDIAAGVAASDESQPILIELAVGITKRLDAGWSPGSGGGGLDTGTSIDPSAWYHAFIIADAAGGLIDVIFSGSISNPALPSGYPVKRRIGHVVTDASANIIAFQQSGDEFRFSEPILNNSGDAMIGGATRIPFNVTVPQGAKFEVEVSGLFWGYAKGEFATIVDPDKASVGPFDFVAAIPSGGEFDAAVVRLWTDANRQVQAWCSAPLTDGARFGLWTRAVFDRRDAS